MVQNSWSCVCSVQTFKADPTNSGHLNIDTELVGIAIITRADWWPVYTQVIMFAYIYQIFIGCLAAEHRCFVLAANHWNLCMVDSCLHTNLGSQMAVGWCRWWYMADINHCINNLCQCAVTKSIVMKLYCSYCNSGRVSSVHKAWFFNLFLPCPQNILSRPWCPRD